MWTQFNSKNLAFSLFYFSCSFRSCSFFLVCECGVFYVHSKLVGWLVWLVCLFVVLILHSVYFSFVFCRFSFIFNFFYFAFVIRCVFGVRACMFRLFVRWMWVNITWRQPMANETDFHLNGKRSECHSISMERRQLLWYLFTGRVAIVSVGTWVGRRPLLVLVVCGMSGVSVCAVQCSTHSYECEHVTRLCAKNRRSYELWILL